MTTVSEHETRRADELKAGDWLAGGQLDCDADRPSQVLGTFPFADNYGAAVLFVYLAQDGTPRTIDPPADTTYQLATQAEMEAGREDALRDKLVAQLRELANLYAEHKLPIPEHAMQVQAYVRTAANVQAAADALGLEVKSKAPNKGVQADWTKGRPSYEAGALHVSWYTIDDESESESDQ